MDRTAHQTFSEIARAAVRFAMAAQVGARVMANDNLTPTGVWLKSQIVRLVESSLSLLSAVNPNRRTWPEVWIGPLTWGFNKNVGLYGAITFRGFIVTAYQAPKGKWHFARYAKMGMCT